MRACAGRGSPGFTLLEVMVALAILASTLVVLLEIATNNVRATNHSRLMSIATFLARGKIVEIEGGILEKGFGELEEEESGDFEQEGFEQFRWEYAIEKVELPSDLGARAQGAAGELTRSDDPMEVIQGVVGGLLSGFMDPIRLGLEASVRRVTLQVFWNEPGRDEQALEVVTFVTDPSKLDLALPSAGAGVPAGGVPSLGSFGLGAGGRR